jgi:hypothetical protein
MGVNLRRSVTAGRLGELGQSNWMAAIAAYRSQTAVQQATQQGRLTGFVVPNRYALPGHFIETDSASR